MASCNIEKSCCGITFAILQFIAACVLAVIMTFSSWISFDAEVSGSIAKELIDNFESVPITDLDQVPDYIEHDSFRNLKESLGLELVRYGNWPGTLKGCGIKGKNNLTSVKLLDDGKGCDLASGEEELVAIPSRYLTSYYGITLSMSTRGKSYYKLLMEEDGSIIGKNEDCQNKKSCGYIDTLENKLCIDNNKQCPINYIKLDYKEPTNVNITKTFIGNGRNMYISNNPYPDKSDIPYIIGKFKIGGEQLCSIPNLYYTEENLYPLDARIKKYSKNCVLMDYNNKYAFENSERLHKLDEIKMYDLYNENGIIKTINDSKLVKYGFDINNEFGLEKKQYLYVRRFYGYDKNCLKHRKEKYKIDQLQDLEQKHTTSERMKVWSIVTKVLIGVSELTTILNTFDFTDSNFGIDVFVKNIFALLVNVGNLGFTCYANSYDDAFEEEFTCSDYITNEIHNIMYKKIKQSGKWIRITNYCIIGHLVLTVILFILHLLIESKKN